MSRTLRLDGPRTALVLVVPERGMPVIAAFTRRLPPGVSLDAAPDLVTRASRINGMDEPPSSAVLLPVAGLGSFQWPAIQGHRGGRDFLFEPAGWVIEAGPGRLSLMASDTSAKLDIGIDLAIADADVLTMRTRLTNAGEGAYHLDRLMAATMLAPDRSDRVAAFDGGWGREFHLVTEPLGSALWIRENRRGRTSHDRYPALIVEGGGECAGLHLGWSGNHVLAIDRLDDGRRLVHAGELFEPGELRLAPGETYHSPSAFMAVASDRTALSEAFHAHVRRHVVAWPGGAMRPRPVTLNTWEGNYFAHDLDRLKRQADAAAALGIERFVLDDGWFGRRDDDTSSLGDWTIDPRKYPQGLKPLIDHVTGLGMEFGLWFEPEMVNPDSDLYRRHPDWVLQAAGRPLLTSRNQLVLDVSRPDVSEVLFARVDAVLSTHAIACVKWDMNRDLTHAGGADGRAAIARQTRAVYALLERVRAAHPAVEIESCASGGGRADYGALARAHRVWTSDCTDALERQVIQAGASLFLPPEVMGAHVSASPNHQTHRTLSLAFRAITALPYHFGVELDPLTLSRTERRALKAFIALHKRLRPLLHGGLSRHHDDGDGRLVHTVLAPDRRRAVVFVAQTSYGLSEQPKPLRIEGLAPGDYRIRVPAPVEGDFFRRTATQDALLAGQVGVPAALLDGVGLNLPALRPESAIVLEITRMRGGGFHG